MPALTRTLDLTGGSRLWPEPELGAWRRAAVRALGELDPSLRVPAVGDPLLRELLSTVLEVPADRILVTAGVRAAAGPLMVRCPQVVVERPTFTAVPAALRAAGIAVRSRPWEDLFDGIEPGTGIWFTSPGRNPDGRDLPPEIAAAAGEAAERGARVVCNTAYRWFGRTPSLADSVLQAGTLHKLAGRGASLGWVVAAPPEEGGGTVAELAGPLSLIAPPWHWQRTWAHFLAADGLELLRGRHGRLGAAREAFLSALLRHRPELSRSLGPAGAGGSGPNVLVPVPPPEEEAVGALAEAGVRVSPGAAFDAGTSSIRVCLFGLTQRESAEAGEIIARAVRGAPDGAGSPG